MPKITHGMSHAPEYSCWAAMKERCRKNQYYIKLGISVCLRWQRFEAFYADMGPRPSLDHSIDRIDPSGRYEPENCRWATSQEQAYNRSDLQHIEFRGERKPIAVWARQMGLAPATVHVRLKRGKSVVDALTTPLHKFPMPSPKGRNAPRIIEFMGLKKTLQEWAREVGVSRAGLSNRLKWWSIERALSKPSQKGRYVW